MRDGPFKQKLFETEIELRLVPVELDMDAKNATYETTRAELYQWCADIANVAYRELHPPVSEGIKEVFAINLDGVPIAKMYSDCSMWFSQEQSGAAKIFWDEVKDLAKSTLLAQGVRVWRTKLMNVSPGWIADAHLWCEVQSEATGEAGIVINIEEVKP